MTFRYFLATSDAWIARMGRSTIRSVRSFTLPAPRPLMRPILAIFLFVRSIVYWMRRVLVAEPLFKAYCRRYGRNVRTDIYSLGAGPRRSA